MCLLVYSTIGDIPPDHLRDALDNNPDGWGIAFPADGKVIVRKGMKCSKFWDTWDELKPDFAGKPLLFHARWATHGDESWENCHPFRLDKKKHPNLVVAHNGVLPMPDHKTLSDTRLFVRDVLNPLEPGFLAKPGVHTLLNFAAKGSRLAFLDGDGKVVIVNEHTGIWNGQVWYSNDSYLPQQRFKWSQTGSYSSTLLKRWEGERADSVSPGDSAYWVPHRLDHKCRDLFGMDAVEVAEFVGIDVDDLEHFSDKDLKDLVEYEEERLYGTQKDEDDRKYLIT